MRLLRSSLMATDLVVLSACETGLGEERTGEGVFGMRRAFVVAGAGTLIMSLWNIPDEATKILMETFYEQLQREEGESPADALRAAQLALRTSPQYRHPVYWGTFI